MITFSNPTVGEDVLLRNAMQSEGFASGSQGWRLERNGDAELNNVLIRGDLRTGVPPNRRIEINQIPGNTIDFYTGVPGDITPGRIIVDTNGFGGMVHIEPSTPAAGAASIPAILEMQNQDDGITSLVQIQAMNLLNLATIHEFQGVTGAMIYDPEAVPQQLNFSDVVDMNGTFGMISAAMRAQKVTDLGASAVTNSTSYTGVTGGNTMVHTMDYPRSGELLVHLKCSMSNSVSNINTWTSFEIRDTNGAGTVRFTPADTRALQMQHPTANGTLTYGATFHVSSLPTSGLMWIQMQHRVSANTGTFARREMAIQPCF